MIFSVFLTEMVQFWGFWTKQKIFYRLLSIDFRFCTRSYRRCLSTNFPHRAFTTRQLSVINRNTPLNLTGSGSKTGWFVVAIKARYVGGGEDSLRPVVIITASDHLVTMDRRASQFKRIKKMATVLFKHGVFNYVRGCGWGI